MSPNEAEPLDGGGEPEPSGARLTLVRRFRDGGLFRAGVYTYFFSGLTLGANLVTGLISARALAPAGRGELIAISTLAQMVGMLFAMSCAQAISYRYARQPERSGRLAGSWIAMLLPLGAVGVLVGELALPTLFAAQSEAAISLGRIYLLTVFLVLWSELTAGLLLGARDYVFANAMKAAQPILIATLYAVLWALDRLTVESALITAAGTAIVAQSFAMARVRRNAGSIGRPDRRLAAETLWYGIRGHGALIGNAMNQRVDLLVLPAFVLASPLGLYSIAANVSLIISTLANTLAAVVLPAAASQADRGVRTVLASLRASSLIALVLAVVLFIFAAPALELVYGREFRASSETLRILLPGTVLLSAASILIAGLYAVNRPTTATVVQLTGLVLNIAGLLIFVPEGGIVAAAVVSSCSYAVVLVSSIVAYRRISGVSWLTLLSLGLFRRQAARRSVEADEDDVRSDLDAER